MTYEDLMEAIADRISELWPERMLYRDFCPSDFKRPSGFLYVVKAGYTDANAGLVRWDFSAELTLYAATDAYTVESTEALRAEQNKVLRQFGGACCFGGRPAHYGRCLRRSAWTRRGICRFPGILVRCQTGLCGRGHGSGE